MRLFTAFVVVLAVLSYLSAEESNEGIDKKVLDVCKRQDSNRKETLKLSGGDTAPACRDQIKTSLENCLKDPGITQEDYRGTFSQVDVATDLQGTVTRQIAAYESGKQKFAKARGACEKEDNDVYTICKQNYQELKTSLAEYRNVTGVSEAAQKVQLQMAATQKARESAMKTIEDQVLCFKYEGDIYDEAIAKTRAAVPQVAAQPSNEVGAEKIEKASVTSDSGAGSGPASSGSAATTSTAAATSSAAKPTPAASTPTSWSSLASGAESAGSKAVGMMSSRGANIVNVATAVNDRDGFQFTTSAASIGATMTESRVLGVVGGLPGAVVSAFLNPDPTSKCAGDFSEPVQAKAAGCELNIHVSSANYDTAITTLKHD